MFCGMSSISELETSMKRFEQIKDEIKNTNFNNPANVPDGFVNVNHTWRDEYYRAQVLVSANINEKSVDKYWLFIWVRQEASNYVEHILTDANDVDPSKNGTNTVYIYKRSSLKDFLQIRSKLIAELDSALSNDLDHSSEINEYNYCFGKRDITSPYLISLSNEYSKLREKENIFSVHEAQRIMNKFRVDPHLIMKKAQRGGKNFDNRYLLKLCINEALKLAQGQGTSEEIKYLKSLSRNNKIMMATLLISDNYLFNIENRKNDPNGSFISRKNQIIRDLDLRDKKELDSFNQVCEICEDGSMLIRLMSIDDNVRFVKTGQEFSSRFAFSGRHEGDYRREAYCSYGSGYIARFLMAVNDYSSLYVLRSDYDSLRTTC